MRVYYISFYKDRPSGGLILTWYNIKGKLNLSQAMTKIVAYIKEVTGEDYSNQDYQSSAFRPYCLDDKIIKVKNS